MDDNQLRRNDTVFLVTKKRNKIEKYEKEAGVKSKQNHTQNKFHFVY